MKPSAAGRRLVESPGGPFLPSDWLALLVICLLAVVIRASVMRFLPSILHPDERMWLDEANRLVNHQGLVTWDFQVGERSWLWPGLIAGFMYVGELFGSPPDASLGGVSALICIISLGPVICGFLWGRNVAGFAGAVTTGVLNAVWFELVYFYAHPLSESAAGAALVTGLYLVYPGRNVWSDRQMFVGAAMLGLAAVLRPQLIPAIALIVVAVGGIRLRAHYPALLGGLALPIVLSGLLDWVTWGWPFHCDCHVCLLLVQGLLRRRPQPVLLLHRLGVGFLGPLQHRDRALRARRRTETAAAVGVAVNHLRGPFRYQSQGIPVYLPGPAAHHDACRVGSTMAADWLAVRLGQTWDPARAHRRPAAGLDPRLARLAASPNRIWFWVRSRGSILAMRAVDADKDACGVGDLSRRHVVARVGLSDLRPGIPLFNAGDTANPIAPGAYNYVVTCSAQQGAGASGRPAGRFRESRLSAGPVLDRPLRSGDAYGAHLPLEAPGGCDSASGKPLTPDVGQAFEELTR